MRAHTPPSRRNTQGFSLGRSLDPIGPTSRSRPTDSLNWAFVLFPLFVSIRQSPALALAGLGILGVLSLRGRPIARSTYHYLPFALLVAASAFPMSRGAPIGELVQMCGAVVVLWLAGRRVTSPQLVDSLTVGLSVYLVANIAGWAAGIQSPAASVRTGLFATQSSFFDLRVLFPFCRSINEPAIVAAALIAFVLVGARAGGIRPRPFLWVGVVAAVFVIEASGTRSPLIGLILLLPVAMLAPRLIRLGPALALAAIALPLYLKGLTTLINVVSDRVEGVAFLARGETASDLAGFSYRGFIWDKGIDFWSSGVGAIPSWVGFGYDGHVQSGVVYSYFVQGGFVNQASALTMHNTFLQQLLDGGYLGLFALLLGLWLTGRRFARAGTPATAAMISIIYFSAAVEVFMAPGFRATPFMIALALSVGTPWASRTIEHTPDDMRSPDENSKLVPKEHLV